MRLIRAFEEALAEVYARGDLPTEMLHLSIGQEATAVGALRANGILGAPYLIAAGAALSAKQRGSDQVAVAIAGDGATKEGMFHEALGFAAVFKLPALIVIENNLYGEVTPLSKHAGLQRLADRVWPMAAPA